MAPCNSIISPGDLYVPWLCLLWLGNMASKQRANRAAEKRGLSFACFKQKKEGKERKRGLKLNERENKAKVGERNEISHAITELTLRRHYGI